MQLCRFMARRYAQTDDRVLTVFVYIGLACTVFELFSFLVDGQPNEFLRAGNILCNTSIYGGTATISVLWVWYVELSLNKDVKKMKPLFFPLFIIWVILIVALVVNIFVPFLFTIDEANVYHREPLGYIYYVFLIASFVISIVEYIRFRVNHGDSRFFPIWMFLVPVIAACIVQAVFYGIACAWLGCAVGLIAIYLNIQSKRSLVDSLTGLYNRAYIEHHLVVARSNSLYVYSGIMLDVDYFKEINDTHGHSIGDRALIDAANMLLSVADRHASVFRFAGDEFIMLVKVPSSRKEELEQITKYIEDKIRIKAANFNAISDKPYKIIFSLGHAFFDPNEEEDAFFRKMDLAMYKEKQLHHGQRK